MLAGTAREPALDDRAMAVVLSVVVTLLIIITALGIIGLAIFSVKTRTKQIGTRRALETTRATARVKSNSE